MTRKYEIEFGHKIGTLNIEVEAMNMRHAGEVAYMTLCTMVKHPQDWQINGAREV